MTQLAQSVSETFVSLDRDLLLAGAVVYYVGAVDLLDAAYNENPNDALIGIAVSSHDKLMQVCNYYLSLPEDADAMELAMKKLIMEGQRRYTVFKPYSFEPRKGNSSSDSRGNGA